MVKLVVVRSGQPTLSQQASASERLGLQSSAAPTSPQGLEGRLAERADPSSPSCPLIGAFGKSGRVLMGHHHQTVSNARTAEGALFAREEVCRCEGRSEGGTEGRREGERERGRKGEREKGRKGERGRGGGEGEKRTAEEQEHRKNIVGGQRSQRFVTALLIIIGREEGVLRTAPCGWPAPLQRPAFGVAGRLSWLAWLALCTEQKGFMISNPAGHLSWGHNRDLDLPVCASRARVGCQCHSEERRPCLSSSQQPWGNISHPLCTSVLSALRARSDTAHARN